MPLVGTPEQIVDGMLAMSEVGLDGCTLSWVDCQGRGATGRLANVDEPVRPDADRACAAANRSQRSEEG
jgi:hypothetical protein